MPFFQSIKFCSFEDDLVSKFIKQSGTKFDYQSNKCFGKSLLASISIGDNDVLLLEPLSHSVATLILFCFSCCKWSNSFSSNIGVDGGADVPHFLPFFWSLPPMLTSKSDRRTPMGRKSSKTTQKWLKIATNCMVQSDSNSTKLTRRTELISIGKWTAKNCF